MERESYSPDVESVAFPPIPAPEPAEEVSEEVAESPAPQPEREVTVTEELHEAFPELTGEGNREQKEVVTECFVGLVESGKMSIPELRQLISEGIYLASEDKEVPDSHRVEGLDEKQWAAATSEVGKLTIYPDFFRDKFNDTGGFAVRQNILNHELGHLLHLRTVEIAITDADSNPVKKREAVVDVRKYSAEFKDVYEQNPHWQHLWPAVQLRMGNQFRLQECLAQDVADYLSAKDVNDWMRIRLRGMPSEDKHTGWNRDELYKKITAGELDDPVAAPFVAHAHEVWDFIESELTGKRGLMGQELTPLSEEADEEAEYAQWLHYESSPAGNTHVTPSVSVDLNFLDKMYSRLFGV